MNIINERMAKRCELPSAMEALPGRDEAIVPREKHFVLNTQLHAPFPDATEFAVFAMGCFWGAERRFWETEGVYTTAVGYVAGHTKNPTYEEVCSGKTGHTEGVLVVFYPDKVSFEDLLILFWESHDPTQGMRQGNDIGTQYRSGVYTSSPAHQALFQQSKLNYAARLKEAGMGGITSEIAQLEAFYYAEAYHQQYLAKNPNGYCGLGGTGIGF